MTDKVTNIFEAKYKAQDAKVKTLKDACDEAEATGFEAEMARNAANAERLAKERLAKSRQVLRDYKIRTKGK